MLPQPIDDDAWKDKLTPEQFRVCREGATEPPFSGKFVHTKDDGTYTCAACGNLLFDSKTKFESGTGWPSFYDVVDKGNIELRDDLSLGQRRTEVLCRQCGSHLGHVFDDGPADKNGLRYCINSLALDFQPKRKLSA